jgi:hypothetical protein
VDPRTLPNYREIAGLPDVNSGRFLSIGTLTDADGVLFTVAEALDGNPGGVSELVVPAPERQILLDIVMGLNPEF